jgi:uncharacterized protein YkwD
MTIFDFDAPARRGITPSDHQRATEQARIAQLSDQEVDAALNLARDLRFLAATNRIRARHDLPPLAAEDIINEARRVELESTARVMSQGVTR